MSGSADRGGASAYAALVEWENYGRLAGLAPGLADRIAVAEASAGALARYRAALDRLIAADQDPAAAMAASVRFVDGARARVAPSTWWEALVVAVVWVPLVQVLAAAAPPEASGADASAPEPGDSAAAKRDGWAVWRVRDAVEADPALGARLALWGRRLGGEAIALAAGFAELEPSVSGPRDAVPGQPGTAVSAVQKGQVAPAGQGGQPDRAQWAASYVALADQVAKAHAAALVPLFGPAQLQPAGR
ncbi:MAG TPA: ferritin-like fold-containing protein [Actinocrinis sp.]|nr:ferritin-like fold-containing protein [Actinocrinis sp.]